MKSPAVSEGKIGTNLEEWVTCKGAQTHSRAAYSAHPAVSGWSVEKPGGISLA